MGNSFADDVNYNGYNANVSICYSIYWCFFYKVEAIHCCYHPQGIATSRTREHLLMGLCISMFFFVFLCQYLAAFLNDVILTDK